MLQTLKKHKTKSWDFVKEWGFIIKGLDYKDEDFYETKTGLETVGFK